MPTADRLASEGLRYNQFHTTALCSPTRTALLSGRNHHTNNMGSITETGHRLPGQHRQAPRQRGAARRDAAAQRLQHQLLREEPRDRDLGDQPLGPDHPLAQPLRLRRVLRVHGRRDQPVGAARLPQPDAGRAPQGPEVPLHDRHDEQGHRLGAVPEVADARTGRSSCTSRRAPPTRRTTCRRSGSRSTRGSSTRAGTSCARRSWPARSSSAWSRPGRSSPPSRRPSRTGTSSPPTEKKLFTRQMEVYAGFAEYTDTEIGRLIDALQETGPARQHAGLLHPRRQRHERRGRHERDVQRDDLLQRRAGDRSTTS